MYYIDQCFFCEKSLSFKEECRHPNGYCFHGESYYGIILNYCALNYYYESGIFRFYIRNNNTSWIWKCLKNSSEQFKWDLNDWVQYMKNYEMIS